MGIKSLEGNFNPVKKTYNPHLHMIVENKEMAEIIVEEWLKLLTDKFAARKAQNMQPIRNKEKALIEIVKYGSKIFTEPDLAAKTKSKQDRGIYIAALAIFLLRCKVVGFLTVLGLTLLLRRKVLALQFFANMMNGYLILASLIGLKRKLSKNFLVITLQMNFKIYWNLILIVL